MKYFFIFCSLFINCADADNQQIQDTPSNDAKVQYSQSAVTCHEGVGVCYYDSQGFLHNDNGPAKITNVSSLWYTHGTLTKSQSLMFPNTTKQYVIIAYYDSQGRHHRDNDLPAIEHSTGEKQWLVHGTLIKSQDANGKITIHTVVQQ
jgi:hypothetical protein